MLSNGILFLQYTIIIFSHPTRGIYFLIHVHNYAKIKGLDLGEITSLPNSENMRHFRHRRKYTARSSQDSFAYNESLHDSYPQFPRSPLGTPGNMPPFSRRTDEKNTLAFLVSPSAKANSINEILVLVRNFIRVSCYSCKLKTNFVPD